MEDLNKYSQTELLKMGNDFKERHDILKKEIITDTHKIEEIEIDINKKIIELDKLEKNYVKIVEILTI